MKPHLGILLALISTSALAKWEPFSRNRDETEFHLIDRASIAVVDGKVRMWEMVDLKVPDARFGRPYSSYKAYYEYNCKANEVRRRAFVIYSGALGTGEVIVNNNDIDPWIAIVPDSIFEAEKKVACSNARK
jgi:hypothetical protein